MKANCKKLASFFVLTFPLQKHTVQQIVIKGFCKRPFYLTDVSSRAIRQKSRKMMKNVKNWTILGSKNPWKRYFHIEFRLFVQVQRSKHLKCNYSQLCASILNLMLTVITSLYRFGRSKSLKNVSTHLTEKDRGAIQSNSWIVKK